MPKQTKRTLKRYLKKDLMKYAKDAGLDVNKKMSKNSIVDKIYKSKKTRSSIPIKDKRKLSEKQRANLAKYRIGKDYKNEKKIKPEAQYVAEIRKIEDVVNIGRGQPNEFQSSKKIGEGKGRFQETQVEELKQSAKNNKDVEKLRKRELKDSTNKTSDLFDRTVDGEGQKEENQKMNAAKHHAKSRKDVRFGQAENEAKPDSSSSSILELMNLPISQLVSKLKSMKQRFESEKEKNPNATPPPLLIVIEELLKKKSQINK